MRRAGGREAVGRASPANLATSLLSAAAHLVSHPPPAAAPVFLPSLVFGVFRDRHGQLTPAAVLHLFRDAGHFWPFGTPA